MLFRLCQKLKRLLLMLRVSCGFDCGYWCQMNTDGPELFFFSPPGSGPGSRGSCPWCEHFHLLVDVRHTDSSRPWIKQVWTGRLGEQKSCIWTSWLLRLTQKALFILKWESVKLLCLAVCVVLAQMSLWQSP